MALRGAVYVNGIIKPAAEAVVPVYDHGFLYGEGVYETLRTYNRVPFLYDRHMGRLRASAGRIYLDVPFSDGDLARWIDDTVAAADAAAGDAAAAWASMRSAKSFLRRPKPPVLERSAAASARR